MFNLKIFRFRFKSGLSSLYVAIPIGIVFLTALFIFLGFRRNILPAPPVQTVILGTAKVQEISETHEYVAQMEANQSVDLKARVSGFLVAKNFADGDLVKKDQTIFQIEPDQYQATLNSAQAGLLSAQAQMDLAQLDFIRISDLYKKNTSPKSDYDRSKAAFEVAKAGFKNAQSQEVLARLNLDYTAIKAPFDGILSDTPYSIGVLLGLNSEVLARVVSLDPILVTFGISDRVVVTQENGSDPQLWNLNNWQVRLRLTPDLYYSRPGSFIYIAPFVDPQTDTIKFKAKFENPNHQLKPGQIVTAIMERIIPDRRILVPKGAVLTDPDGNYVLIPKEVPAALGVSPNTPPMLITEARRVTLDSGETDQDYFIKDGLAEGEKFIATGLLAGSSTLLAGAPIRLATPEEIDAASSKQTEGSK